MKNAVTAGRVVAVEGKCVQELPVPSVPPMPSRESPSTSML